MRGLAGGLQWQKCMSWSRKCYFLSSEMEKTQVKRHIHTAQSMAMMENLQTQNDTALSQWVSWNKSFNMTGGFGSEQIKLSYTHNLKLHKWTNIFGPNESITLFYDVCFVKTFSRHKT